VKQRPFKTSRGIPAGHHNPISIAMKFAHIEFTGHLIGGIVGNIWSNPPHPDQMLIQWRGCIKILNLLGVLLRYCTANQVQHYTMYMHKTQMLYSHLLFLRAVANHNTSTMER